MDEGRNGRNQEHSRVVPSLGTGPPPTTHWVSSTSSPSLSTRHGPPRTGLLPSCERLCPASLGSAVGKPLSLCHGILPHLRQCLRMTTVMGNCKPFLIFKGYSAYAATFTNNLAYVSHNASRDGHK